MGLAQVLGGRQNWRSRDKISVDNNSCPVRFNMLTTDTTNFSFDPTWYSGGCCITDKVPLASTSFGEAPFRSCQMQKLQGSVIQKNQSVEVMLSCQRIILIMKQLQSSFLGFVIYISNLKSPHSLATSCL